jgi:hypothetical protein
MKALHIIVHIRITSGESGAHVVHDMQNFFDGVLRGLYKSVEFFGVIIYSEFHQPHHNFVFVFEVEVYRFLRHADVSGDIVHGHILDPETTKQLIGAV